MKFDDLIKNLSLCAITPRQCGSCTFFDSDNCEYRLKITAELWLRNQQAEIEQLKKQQERDEGCAYCDIAKNSPIVYLEYLNRFGFLGGNTQVDEVTRKSISHCPMCGRKLVE